MKSYIPLFGSVVFCCALSTFAPTAAADDARVSGVDREFLKQAPAILQYARDKGYKNIGVLKFRIKKGDEPLSDSVGTLNTFLASRLQVALVLANPLKAEQQVGIIDNASAVAATIPGASHVTAAGRQLLFTGDYPLAWGNEKVKADAFLTGVVVVPADLGEMTIGILAFDPKSETLEKAVPVFTARTAPSQLPEMGESFTLRGAFDKGSVNVVKPATPKPEAPPPESSPASVVEEAAKVRAEGAKHPLQDPAAPVALDVFYDGVPARIDFRDGKAFLAEPQEGQQVTLGLRRTATAQGRLAVVLKVNGENTLFRQKLPDLDCRKWILEPNAPPIAVIGYQLDTGVAEAFRVLSQAESQASAMNYGSDVGMISVTVFREQGPAPSIPVQPAQPRPSTPTPKPSPTPQPSPTPAQPKSPTPSPGPAAPLDLPDEEAEDLLALTRGIMPAEKPKNLAALKFQLREGGRTGSETRGLIAQGEKTQRAIRITTFTPDPTPVMSAAVIYYKADVPPAP
jgi:hypothetical protein